MDQTKDIISPMQILKEAGLLWAKNLIPLMSLNSLVIMIQIVLSVGIKTMLNAGGVKQGELYIISFAAAGIYVIANIVVISFFCLMSFYYLRTPQPGKAMLKSAIKDAGRRLVAFLKSGLLITAFIAIGSMVAIFILAFGKILYVSLLKSAGHNAALGALLTTSTAFVVIAIAVAWYTFFFSLGPLAAAYESIPAVLSLRASRDRMRGKALRFLAALGSFVALYFIVGLGVLYGIAQFTQDKSILNMIDPLMGIIFGPLGLAVWYVSYRRLTEARKTMNN